MMVLVTYDVNTATPEGKRRLRNVAKICENHGQRVQYSVFECLLDPAQWTVLKAELEAVMDKEKDSLRYYFLGASWQHKVEHVGAKQTYDPEGFLLV